MKRSGVPLQGVTFEGVQKRFKKGRRISRKICDFPRSQIPTSTPPLSSNTTVLHLKDAFHLLVSLTKSFQSSALKVCIDHLPRASSDQGEGQDKFFSSAPALEFCSTTVSDPTLFPSFSCLILPTLLLFKRYLQTFLCRHCEFSFSFRLSFLVASTLTNELSFLHSVAASTSRSLSGKRYVIRMSLKTLRIKGH